MWPCDRVTVWPCDRLTVWPCDRVTVWPCDRVTVWPCDRVTVWPCDRGLISKFDGVQELAFYCFGIRSGLGPLIWLVYILNPGHCSRANPNIANNLRPTMDLGTIQWYYITKQGQLKWGWRVHARNWSGGSFTHSNSGRSVRIEWMDPEMNCQRIKMKIRISKKHLDSVRQRPDVSRPHQYGSFDAHVCRNHSSMKSTWCGHADNLR